MINVIVFSKDRACQLNALLESFKSKFHASNKLSILFAVSESRYLEGYLPLMEMYPEYHFIQQSNFKKDVRNLMSEDFEHTMFLVDDAVFIRDVNEKLIDEFRANREVLTLSLALSTSVTFEYPRQKSILIPEIKGNIYNWLVRWKKRGDKNSNEWGGGWDCPMSVGGNVFLTRDIYKYIKNVKFHNPNSLECNMQKKPIKNKPTMMCCDNAKLLCIPVNVVQKKYKNRHGDVSAKDLNDIWLKGLKIDVSKIYGVESNAIHKVMDLSFTEIG